MNFVIGESLELICHEENLKDPTVGVVGLGFTGSNVANYLASKYKVIGYDVRKMTESLSRNLILTTDAEKLRFCDVVVLLSTGGDDIKNLIQKFKDGTVFIDDNHPPLHPSLVEELKLKKKGKVYRAVIGANGVRFIPRLPNYAPEWIPGCVIEATVANDLPQNQEAFNVAAKAAGFHAFKAYHRGANI